MLNFARSLLNPLPRRLPARVLKRVSQIRRLGPQGFARTAYASSVAPALYSLTEPGRHLASIVHRRRTLRNPGVGRAELVKRRFAAVAGRMGSNDHAGVTTRFGSHAAFVNAIEALTELFEAGCAVPAPLAMDWSRHEITTAFVDGKKAAELTPEEQSPALVSALEQALLGIHRAGYVLGDIDSGSVLLAGRRPVVVDLRNALPLAGLGRDMSIHLRDQDRRRFNQLFGTRLVTAATLRASPAPVAPESIGRAPARAPIYAPVTIRDDISWGNLWNTDVGIGRWNFIMRDHLPVPSGGSILDLGSNNGFNPLQMLRAGAASAVGVEIDDGAIRQGEFLKTAYEWLDNRSYDFRYIHGSQGDLHVFGLPRFDVVTAFCSLYYLSERDMVETIRFIRRLSDTLVVQCNLDRLIDRNDEDTYRKASVEFAIEALASAGFGKHEVIAPPGYSRPLVIARA